MSGVASEARVDVDGARWGPAGGSPCRWAPKALIALVVIAAHAWFLGSLDRFTFVHARWRFSVPVESFATVEVIPAPTDVGNATSLPMEQALSLVSVDPPRVVQIADPQDAQTTASKAAATMPHLSPAQSVDVRKFARRAGVAAGHPLFVVLSVRVGTDGKAGAITVLRSGGSSVADAAAVDYAHDLQWIPGTVQGAPRSMLVILPVTLDPAASPFALLGNSRFTPPPSWTRDGQHQVRTITPADGLILWRTSRSGGEGELSL